MSSRTSRSRRLSERSSRAGGPIVLIVLGVFFLLQQQQQVLSNTLNWWALLIMLPSILWIFEALTQQGTANSLQTRKLFFGAALVLIGLVFLLNIQVNFLPDIPWATIWPLFLIVGGAALLLRKEDGTTS